VRISNPPEAELVARAAAGDARAYEALVDEHGAIAHRIAYLIVGDAAEAEEVVQDALVKAYRALGRFRREAPFRPWLLRIVANEARNHRRAAGRRAALTLRAAATPGEPEVPSPERLAIAAESRADLLRAVDSLREEDRLVIACRYFVGLSEDETAAALGVARGTVKSRTSRALTRLRDRLEEVA
jgi:RNA polymerase sigma-70 factor (ECF subfamily)